MRKTTSFSSMKWFTPLSAIWPARLPAAAPEQTTIGNQPATKLRISNQIRGFQTKSRDFKSNQGISPAAAPAGPPPRPPTKPPTRARFEFVHLKQDLVSTFIKVRLAFLQHVVHVPRCLSQRGLPTQCSRQQAT